MSKPRRRSKGRIGTEVSLDNEGRGQENRVDPAHGTASTPCTKGAAAPERAVSVAAARGAPNEATGEAANERILAQAEQLALHLRDRQREIDHRESQVNARLAAIDRDMRAARLWLNEREVECAARAEALDERQADLEKREAELKRREAEKATPRTGPNEKECALAEIRLQEACVEAESLRDQLREAWCEFREETRQERRRLAMEQRAALAEIEQQRETVRRRGEHVDQSFAALGQLRTELGRMHRETLEIRLATEELWVQLSGAAPPAALTKSLSGIRSKLADHYRLANSELQEQKQELESIRRQLAEQYEKVVQQKRNYDRWAQQHREEAEADASRLAAREADLHQLEVELNDRALQWQAQRLDYERQIRVLQDQHAGHQTTTA